MNSHVEKIKSSERIYIVKNNSKLTVVKHEDIERVRESDFDPSFISLKLKGKSEQEHPVNKILYARQVNFVESEPKSNCTIGSIVSLSDKANLWLYFVTRQISKADLLMLDEPKGEGKVANLFEQMEKRHGRPSESTAKIINIYEEGGISIATIIPESGRYRQEVDIPLNLCKELIYTPVSIASDVDIPGVIKKGDILVKVDDYYQSDLGSLLIHESEINLIKGDVRICKR